MSSLFLHVQNKNTVRIILIKGNVITLVLGKINKHFVDIVLVNIVVHVYEVVVVRIALLASRYRSCCRIVAPSIE